MYKYEYLHIQEADENIYQLTFNAMSPERKEKIIRLKNENQKKLSLLGEYLAKKMISDEKGIPFNRVILETDSKGKPYTPAYSDIHFNISHSHDIAVAVIHTKPIGIDIEKVHKVSLKLSEKVCTEDELVYIFGKLPTAFDFETGYPDISYTRFFEIWTLKEAYFKYIGTGITDFKSVDSFKTDFAKDKITIDDYIIHIVY